MLLDDDQIIECIIRGKFREKDIRFTNPVAVGDHVRIELEKGQPGGIITEILDRKNYILRKSSNLSKQSQILASNIDQLFLMITIILPETANEFIDRFLITAEAYRIPAFLIINKTDIYSENDLQKMQEIIQLYSGIGYECFTLSVKENKGINVLTEKMKGKISLVAGNSGVGKTSLINHLNPVLNLKTEEISDYHKQGKHITTLLS